MRHSQGSYARLGCVGGGCGSGAVSARYVVICSVCDVKGNAHATLLPIMWMYVEAQPGLV
jgi:hypothetical protein